MMLFTRLPSIASHANIISSRYNYNLHIIDETLSLNLGHSTLREVVSQ